MQLSSLLAVTFQTRWRRAYQALLAYIVCVCACDSIFSASQSVAHFKQRCFDAKRKIMRYLDNGEWHNQANNKTNFLVVLLCVAQCMRRPKIAKEQWKNGVCTDSVGRGERWVARTRKMKMLFDAFISCPHSPSKRVSFCEWAFIILLLLLSSPSPSPLSLSLWTISLFCTGKIIRNNRHTSGVACKESTSIVSKDLAAGLICLPLLRVVYTVYEKESVFLASRSFTVCENKHRNNKKIHWLCVSHKRREPILLHNNLRSHRRF